VCHEEAKAGSLSSMLPGTSSLVRGFSAPCLPVDVSGTEFFHAMGIPHSTYFFLIQGYFFACYNNTNDCQMCLVPTSLVVSKYFLAFVPIVKV
jgi:hypothetical protein